MKNDSLLYGFSFCVTDVTSLFCCDVTASLSLSLRLSSFSSVSALYSPLHLLHLSSFLPLPVVFLFVSLFHWLQRCSRDSDIFSNLCFKACLYLDKCSICTHANTHTRTRKVFLFISAQGSAMETGKDNWTNSLHRWQCHLEWIAYYSKQHNFPKASSATALSDAFCIFPLWHQRPDRVAAWM